MKSNFFDFFDWNDLFFPRNGFDLMRSTHLFERNRYLVCWEKPERQKFFPPSLHWCHFVLDFSMNSHHHLELLWILPFSVGIWDELFCRNVCVFHIQVCHFCCGWTYKPQFQDVNWQDLRWIISYFTWRDLKIPYFVILFLLEWTLFLLMSSNLNSKLELLCRMKN